MWVPYTCYYHMYYRRDIELCAQRAGVRWTHVTGEGQQREFVTMLQKLNGDDATTDQLTTADMDAGGMRVTWQAWPVQMSRDRNATDTSAHTREFASDRVYFDAINLGNTQHKAAKVGPAGLTERVCHGDVAHASVVRVCWGVCVCVLQTDASSEHRSLKSFGGTENNKPDLVLLNSAAVARSWYQVRDF